MGKPGVEALFAGNSEIAVLMRSQFAGADETANESQLPLGAIETWSTGLRNAFGILLNSSCPMFLVWDCDPAQKVSGERILFYNDAYLTLLKDAQQLIPCGRSISESWTGDWSSVQSDVEHVFTTGQPWRREKEPFPFPSSNAKRHDYTWSYNAIWNETDQVSGVFATGYPVVAEETTHPSALPPNNQAQLCSSGEPQTQSEEAFLQRAEAALQESEARFQTFMSHSPTSAWIADQDGRLLYLSPTYAQMFQFPGQDGVGKQIHDMVSEKFTQPFLENNRRVFETGQVIETIETAPRPDGSIGSFLVYKFPIPQASGAMLLGGVAIDMTERHRTEDVLRRREEELRLITNAVPVLIAYIDKDYYYRFNNRAYEDWLGQPTASLAGKHLREALGESVYKTVLPYMEQAMAGERVSFESQLSYRNGETRYVSASYVPHRNSQGEVEGFFSLVSDISDRKQVELALRQSEERLRLAQKAAGAGLWDWDIVTNQVTWSDEYYRLYGLDTTVVASYENWLASILEADRARVDQTTREALEQRTNLNVEFRILHPTEGKRWLTAIGQTFYDEHGQPKRMTGIALDVTKRKQAEKALERYQLLSEHSRDIVLYFRVDGQILEANQAAERTYGYDRAELLTLTVADLRAPDTRSIMPEQFEQAIQRGILFETVHRRKDGTDFPVEVSAQSAVIGDETVLLSVIRNITERKRAELDREQLLVREQVAREAAEAAEQRARFLAEASTTLTSSLDYAYTLSSVAQAVVPTLADWCAIDILNDDGTLERLATTHVDPAKVQWGKELHHRYPPDLNAPRGLAQVLRTGQPEYYPTISDEQIVMSARDPDHLKILREIGFSSAMLVPLNARGKTLGAISFVSAESGRSYSLDDLSLAEELARRAAIALDNARLYQEAQQARQVAERAADRTARLQAVTAALSESLTPEQVAEVIVEQSTDILKASAVLVVLVSKDRKELEIVKSVGYTEDLVETWRRFSIDADVPLAEAIRTGEPAWFETILERIARYPYLIEIYQRYDFEAWIALPLVVEGKSVGGMLLSFKEYQHPHQDDRDFILALTQQCAQAIVRAQLYEAEQQARAEAERANRIKDEFLAVLSHELRSPLNPILGWSRLLQTHQFDEAGTQRALETIERNAKLQTQLIDDLLDVSRILRGKLVLNGCPTNLVNVIDAAFETVRLSAEAKGIDIKRVVEGEVGLALGDAGRLQQVVWNLLSNAVKFTPEGGHVEVRLAQVESGREDANASTPQRLNASIDRPSYAYAQIQVKDTGKGINPEFLPHMFEYFRQEDGAITRRFGGLGLGLAIVRHMVELHGGTVEATSPGEGQGSTFTVRLPLLKDAGERSKDETATLDPPFSIFHPLGDVQVLLVDDDADSRDVMAFVLEQAGATVTAVTSAREALQALERAKPDVLVSDIGMPEKDGYMLIQQIRALSFEQGGQIPAIALTAYAGESNQQQALSAGFQTHVSKPVEPGELIAIVARLCGRKSGDV